MIRPKSRKLERHRESLGREDWRDIRVNGDEYGCRHLDEPLHRDLQGDLWDPPIGVHG